MRFGLSTGPARRVAPGLLVGVALGHAALAQTWTGASDNPADLRYRLDLLDAELADIRARLGGTSGISTPSPSGNGSSIEVGRLEAEVARLTGQVERLQFENRQLKEKVERQLEDLIFRVTELEGGDVTTVPTVNLGGTATGQAAQPVVLSEQADLDRAKLDIQQGRFDQGEDRLRSFIQSYPSSSLVGEAHFWLGQSQFVRGAFPDAASTYLAGYRADSRGVYAPDNLLKLGTTLGRLGQLEAGCQTLNEVSRQFPGASSSVQQGVADERAALGCQ